MQDSHRVETQRQKTGGVTMSVHRYVEKRFTARMVPGADGISMHPVVEPTQISQLCIELDGDGVKLEPGALQYMHGRITSDVVANEPGRGFLSRAIASAGTGEAAHSTLFEGKGTIWCEPGRQNFIIATMDGPEDALLLDDRAFYACSKGISLSTHRHQNVTGVLSGNGLMQPKLSGNGIFAVESPVPVEEVTTIEVHSGETVTVDGDYMLMYSAGLDVAIGPLVKGLRKAMRSGEGFVYRFTGQGLVWVMPTAKLL